MPLLNEKVLEPWPLPTAEAVAARENRQVFYIPFTGEIFASYLEYFDRIMLYRSNIWSCSITGKSKLTYKQALESERKAFRKIEVKYPKVWIKPTLEIIQHSINVLQDRMPLNEVVDQIYDYFRGTRFVDEIVFVDVPTTGSDRAVERAVIREKLPSTTTITLEKRPNDKRQMQRDLRESREDTSRIPDDPHHYRIQLVNNPAREYIVTPSQMRRPRQVLSKQTFKKYVKDVASKEKWYGSPWKVKVSETNKGHLALRYGLKTDVPTENGGGLKPMKKKRSGLETNDSPIEDTELFAEEYNTVDATSRPKPTYEIGKISPENHLHLIQSYVFLYTYGAPLKLYPFMFIDYLNSLECKSYAVNCQIMPEVFSTLLGLACAEYQSKFELNTGLNPYTKTLPQLGGDGKWSENKEESDQIAALMEQYDKFSNHERIAVDQWYKWRPGQYSHWPKQKKAKLAQNDNSTRIKGWPIALYGLIRDWFGPKDSRIKWAILHKLLFTEVSQTTRYRKEKPGSASTSATQSDEDESSISVQISDQNSKKRPISESGDYEPEVLIPGQRMTRARLAKVSAEISNSETASAKPSKTPIKKAAKKPKKTPKQKVDDVQFDELALKMEHGFWSLTADERVLLLGFLVDVCVLDSDLLRAYRDDSSERVTELKKEKREIARVRRGLGVSIAELEKKINELFPNGVDPTAQSGLKLEQEKDDNGNYSDGSDNDEDAVPTRRTRTLNNNSPTIDTASRRENMTEEQILLEEEMEDLRKQDSEAERRENVLEFEIRATQGASCIKPLGRDRFCNKYWWFDGGLGAVAIDAITKIHIESPTKADPFIAQEFSTGVLFVEEFIDSPEKVPPELFDTESGIRKGDIDGRWGFYSTPEELEQLTKSLDQRGVREAGLYNNLEFLKDFIEDGMKRRAKLIQDEAQELKEHKEKVAAGEAVDDDYREPYLEYENHWA